VFKSTERIKMRKATTYRAYSLSFLTAVKGLISLIAAAVIIIRVPWVT